MSSRNLVNLEDLGGRWKGLVPLWMPTNYKTWASGGPKYTWYNRREGSQFVEERLDRAFATQGWYELFLGAKLEVMAMCSSDHTPIFLPFLPACTEHQGRPRRFHYESS